jgi:signal transduction histidine kinase
MVGREIGSVLIRARGAEMGEGAARVAEMLSGGLSVSGQRFDSISGHPVFRRALASTAGLEATSGILAGVVTGPRDTTRLLVQLVGPEGALRGEHRLRGDPIRFDWALDAARAGALPVEATSLSPVLDLGRGIAGFARATPVRDDGGRFLGWAVDVRRIQARGVDNIRSLIGVNTMLMGQRGEGVWTDLTRVVPPPAHVDVVDSARRVTSEARGDAVGIARPIAGTPWVVWVETPADEVLAPMRVLFARLWPAVAFIALLGAGFAWLLAHLAAMRIRTVAHEIDRTLAAHGATAPAGADDELAALERSYARLEERVGHQRRLDEQVLQSQKLEAVGRLAGGVAHDFNNLLTVVSNYGELVRERLPADSPEAADMAEVLRASERAAALTRQLLAFSRQHRVDPRPIDMNEAIIASDRMLARLIPSNVERVLELARDLPVVTADSVHLEQVLMNLVLNALDSMPTGGRLVLRTTREVLDAADGPGGALPGGPHACLAVSDTGAGMDSETLARVFDPFFTTKAVGKGTGLGLATVHGIVGQARGRVWAYSEPGHGTTMKVYFPATDELPSAELPPERRERVRTPGAGLVLVVEDDPGTRAVTCRLLSRHGFTVREFVRADLALDWLGRGGNAATVTAVVSDVMMPGTSGLQLARAAGERWPALPFVLMSGYAGAGDEYAALSGPRPVILDKPFTSVALLDALDRALGR